MSEQIESLGSALPKQQARVRGLILQYREIGPAGNFAIMMMEQALREADQAVIHGDIVGMLRAYESLKGFNE